MTVAAFMDLALYHPHLGYYTRAAQRSGRAGDFFTSVDVGPLFGRLLAIQIAEMFEIIADAPGAPQRLDLVEAGAGNGRLACDVLAGLSDVGSLLDRIDLHLIEESPAARQQHQQVIPPDHPFSSEKVMPDRFTGVLYANELLDAMPVHRVVMRAEGLREIYVTTEAERLTTIEGPVSTDRLERHLRSLDVELERGWTAEIGLAAVDWIRSAARALERGFVILVDYGHPAGELYSVTHAQGTLTSFTRQTMAGSESRGDGWLMQPGEQDITAHVDFTSVQRAAESEGMTTLGFLDQTYFVMALAGLGSATHLKDLEHRDHPAHLDHRDHRAALKTLMMPGGLGSTMKVLILGKNVGRPALQGCSYRIRVT